MEFRTEIVRCPKCGGRNRIRVGPSDLQPICGRCRSPLESGAAKHTSEGIDDITDIDQFLVELMKRGSWSRIPEAILRQIVDNAQGDIEKVKRFRYVSDLHNYVEDHYLSILERHSDPKLALAMFSVHLERLAASSALAVPELPDRSEEQTMAIGTADIAYLSSILCNPLMLPSYVGLAHFYIAMGSRDLAAAVCREYEAAEQELLNSCDSDLDFYNRAMKDDIRDVRKSMEEAKKELGI